MNGRILKHGADYRRQWRKVHLGVDAQTLEIRAIEVTDNAIGDTPMTVLGAQVARGALDDVQSLGECERVGEVMQADATYEAPCVGEGSRTDQSGKKHVLVLRFAPEIIRLILGCNSNE